MICSDDIVRIEKYDEKYVIYNEIIESSYSHYYSIYYTKQSMMYY